MSTSKNNFYVYCHQTKDDGKCFYVGKGRGRRAYSKDKRNPHWKRKVAKHGGFDVVILVNNISEEKAFELEMDFIKQIGRENLVNMTDGGEGGMSGCFGDKHPMFGKTHSEESRKKQSMAKIGENHPMFGKHHSEETLKKLSCNKKGDKNPCFGKFGKDHHSSKSINQYSKDGNFIRIWDSMLDIQRELKISNKCISNCCRGLSKTAGGFIWEYANILTN